MNYPMRPMTSKEQGLWRWIREHPPLTVTLGGAALFGALRIVDNHFYSQLGTSASEVGQSQAESIASVVSAILSVAVASLFLVAVYGGLFALWSSAVTRSNRRREAIPGQGTDGRSGGSDDAGKKVYSLARRIGIVVLVVTLFWGINWVALKVSPGYAAIILLVLLPGLVLIVREFSDGTVVAVFLAASILFGAWLALLLTEMAVYDLQTIQHTVETRALTPLGITAEYVTFEYLDDVTGADGDDVVIRPRSTQYVVYLGANNGITVLYDPSINGIVRVPSSSIIVTAKPRTH